MKRYVIERQVPGLGLNDDAGFCSVAKVSNAAISKLSSRVHWETTYVIGDGTYCVYLAEDEAAIREHARISGIPVDKITPVIRIIDPTTAG